MYGFTDDGKRVGIRVGASGAVLVDADGGAGGALSYSRSTVAASTSDTQLVAANTARRGLLIFNGSNQDLLIGLGDAAVSGTSYSISVPPDFLYEFPAAFASAEVRGIWAASATGSALITEAA